MKKRREKFGNEMPREKERHVAREGKSLKAVRGKG